MQRVTLLIWEDLWDGFRLAASERGKSRQQFVREILAQANGAAIAKRGVKAVSAPPPPKDTGPKDTGYSIDWDKVVPPEVIEREARERAAAGDAPPAPRRQRSRPS